MFALKARGGGRAVSYDYRSSGQEFRSDLMCCLTALFEARDVVDRGLRDGCERLAGEKALMACNEDIRECQEARENIILQHGFRQVSEEEITFFFIDIEAQRPNPSRLQSGDDSAGIHDGSPARIDQHRTLADQLERVRIDQMMRLRRERAMDGYDVGSFHQLGERHVGHAPLLEGLIRDWVEGQ